MQLQLSQLDIEAAIKNYVSSAGITLPVSEITFTQTRNPTRITAEITIGGTLSNLHNTTSSVVAESVNDAAFTPDEEDTEADNVEEEEETPKETTASLFAGR